MSKTLNALNEVHQAKRDHHALSISSPHAAIGKYIQEKVNEKMQVDEERRHQPSPFLFQAIVIAVGITAVLLNLFLLNLNRQHGTQASIMKSMIVSQDRKIQLLADNVKDLKQSVVAQKEDFTDALQASREKLKKSEMKLVQVQEASAQQASALDDLKWKVQSLMEKYIELNARLKDFTVQEQKGN